MTEENRQNIVKITAVKLPERLTLCPAAANNWKIFRQRWSQYEVITDLDTAPTEKKKTLFLHCLDDDALEDFNTFQLDDDATLQNIIDTMENFIIGTASVTYERFLFNKRNQQEFEAFELFYADLQRVIKTCAYCANCRSSILKDRIVLGIRDSEVQKELLKKRNLTLEICVDTCKASEKASMQNTVLRSTTENVNKLSRYFIKNQN